MVKISKMKTVKRFAILSSCVTSVAAGIFCAAKFTKTDETNAITAAGNDIEISYVTEGTSTDPDRLGWVKFRPKWSSPMFLVQPEGSSIKYTAFCLDPNTYAPTEGTNYQGYDYKAVIKEDNAVNNQIKLAIYLATAPITDTVASNIMNEWFSEDAIGEYWDSYVAIDPTINESYQMRNYKYIMTHALVGYLNNKDSSDRRYQAMMEALPALQKPNGSGEFDWIEDRIADLEGYISSNAGIWQTAQKYKLYGLDLTEFTTNNITLQDVAWIEAVPYSLDTYAADGVDSDKYVEAAKDAKVTDSIDYCGEKGVSYTILGTIMDKSTNSALEINGEEVTASVTVTPTADSGCGTTSMTFDFDASELGGKELVVFESLFSSGNTLLAEHKDWNDSLQTVDVIFLDTDASDKSDKDKEVYATKDAVVTDNIKYCLPAGTEYTFVGVLMNKEKGEPLTVDDKMVVNSAVVTPAENCGELNMDFEFDATGLAGTEIVAFEYAGIETSTQLSDDDICIAYDADSPEEGDATCSSYLHAIISHQDLNDAAQTVLIAGPPKTPETGVISSEKGSSDSANKIAIAIAIAAPAICVATYIAHRIISKKKFLGKR